MKKRIISFLLAFATLFSCMSVSIFAVDSANVATEEQGEGGPGAGDVLENTLAPHTDELIKQLVAANGSKYIFLDGKSWTGASKTDSVGRFALTDDGRYVYGKDTDGVTATDSDAHISPTAHSDTATPGSLLAYYKTSVSKDKKLVFSIDLSVTDTFINETSKDLKNNCSVSVINWTVNSHIFHIFQTFD